MAPAPSLPNTVNAAAPTTTSGSRGSAPGGLPNGKTAAAKAESASASSLIAQRTQMPGSAILKISSVGRTAARGGHVVGGKHVNEIVVPSRTAFWIVGACIGLIYGGVATAERPLLLSLVPDVEAGRFFSLMVLSSRAAAVVGPFVWAFAVDGLTPSLGIGFAYRAGVTTVAIGMALALWMLHGVPDNFTRPVRS